MISSILLTSLLLLGSSSRGEEFKLFNCEDVAILPVEEKENYDFSKNEGVIFLDLKTENNLDISTLESKKMIDVNVVTLGEYYYKIDDNKFAKGIINGTQFTKKEEIYKIAKELARKIKDGALKYEYLSRKRNNLRSVNDNFNIGGDWNLISSYRVRGSLDYNGAHYADMAEWREMYYINTDNFTYYLLTNETYSTPNTNNTDDYRTEHIIYEFTDNSPYYLLRDYGPKARNPEVEITESSSIGVEINSDNSFSINAEFSVSYSTIKKSPEIRDQGNMARDIAKIDFFYLNARKQTQPWFNYNKGQSMQCSYYIVREDINNTIATSITDNRTISIVDDDFWPRNNNTVNFKTIFNETLNVNN